MIPVPDEKWGEVPKALVVLKPDAPRRGDGTDRILPLAPGALQMSALR